jgi:hypothetical protein
MQNTSVHRCLYSFINFFSFSCVKMGRLRELQTRIQKHFKFPKIQVEKYILPSTVLRWELKSFKFLFICM